MKGTVQKLPNVLTANERLKDEEEPSLLKGGLPTSKEDLPIYVIYGLDKAWQYRVYGEVYGGLEHN